MLGHRTGRYQTTLASLKLLLDTKMLDQLAFVHTSGLVIWQSAEQPDVHPIDQLITLVYVEKRVIPSPYILGNYALYYLYIKELSLFAIAIIKHGLTIPGIEDILTAMTHLFIKDYEASIRVLPIEYVKEVYQPFSAHYDGNLKSLISTGKTLSARGLSTQQNEREPATGKAAQMDPDNMDNELADSPVAGASINLADVKAKIKQMTFERQESLRASKRLYAQEEAKKSNETASQTKRRDPQAEEFLQYSKIDNGESPAANAISEQEAIRSGKSSHIADAKSLVFTSSKETIFGLFNSKKELTANDLEKLLSSLRQALLSQNVASEVADELLKGVSANLEGEKIGLFSRTKSLVIQTLKDSIRKIVQFEDRFLLKRILAAKEERAAGRRSRPYVICMTGVNGVGKTTSIAKLLYIFRNNDFRSLVCACDSFRSGAVEQLQEHCTRLGATLYSQGYGKNASAIAKYGIKEAESLDYDICLIDTTGRQYNNGPLMQALGVLVLENAPDVVLFVGEALTGNEGIEQLKQFDCALRSYTNSRGVDGIILTKFDTCGDKVGAALNLCFVCNIPIIYVGTGQSYPDFAILDPSHIADLIVGK